LLILVAAGMSVMVVGVTDPRRLLVMTAWKLMIVRDEGV
jgi:hypothetical protein